MATKEFDKDYDDTQLKEFIAFNIKRSAVCYKEGVQKFNFSSNVVDNFKNKEDAKDLREFAIKTYGKEFCEKYLSIK
jgi:hypothetical protein